MTDPSKFERFIEDMDFSELEAPTSEQDQMILMDELLAALCEVPLDALIESLTVADMHLLNSIADMPVIPEPTRALIIVMVLYRLLFDGDEFS